MPSVSRAALAAAVLLTCACGSSANGPDACGGGSLTALSGPNQSTAKHVAVQLDGSASGARGDVSYTWRLDAIPPGSTASLSTPSAARSGFTTDQSGVYVASLVVGAPCGASEPATTVIAVANRPPVASAGPDLHVAAPGVPVTLDGSASSDPDQDAISYQWSLVTKPPNSSAVLSSGSAKAPILVPDQFGTYVAVLSVSDGATSSTPVAVVLQVGVTGPIGNCVPAAAPVASAGPDQTTSFGSFVRLD